MALISSSSSVVKAGPSTAFKFFFSCSTELAPMRTLVTKSSFRIHASAISASDWPLRCATSFSAWMRFKVCSVSDSFFR